MQHLYGVQSSANTNTLATNIPTANKSSAELCSIATDDMSLSNELHNGISAVAVVRLRRQQKSLNLDHCTKNSIYLKPVEYVR
jgi:hypothetical protein